MSVLAQKGDSCSVVAGRVFSEKYERPCVAVSAAPGRVNLIGEHIDYSGGYVLPMAIDRYTVVAIAPSSSGQVIRIGSGLAGETVSIRVDAGRQAMQKQPAWAQYVLGVVQLMLDAGETVEGFDAWIESDVPLGAGLSSSAALEVATVLAVDAIHGRQREPIHVARICQKAEHEFAGVPCGIMDMAVSAAAKAGQVVLLDCLNEQIDHVPLSDQSVSILIANTNVTHCLTDGTYASRRENCERAAKALGLSVLRHATLADIENARARLGPNAYRRARHVVTENLRTLEASENLRQKQWERFGQNMYDSHASLRDDFEVSCNELDTMVEIARSIGVVGGVYGSRMTGGGFGGCTVSLVRTDKAPAIAGHLIHQYKHRTGIEPSLFLTQPARGAHIIDTKASSVSNPLADF